MPPPDPRPRLADLLRERLQGGDVADSHSDWPDILVYRLPNEQGYVTISTLHRCWCFGWTTHPQAGSGVRLGPDPEGYSGRGWQARLCDDIAAAVLDEL